MYYKKKLFVGMRNYKKMYVELEIKTENKERMTIDFEPINSFNTLSICGNGGQNINEIADIKGYTKLFISEDDLNAIVEIWNRWHLNDMKAGSRKQQSFIDEWKKTNKYSYDKACKALKEAGLYEDNGYKYGHSWLVELIPDEVIIEITTIFNKYNNIEHIEKKTDTAFFKQFKIKANYKGDKSAKWNRNNYNNYLITVTNTEIKERCTFEFWASIAKPDIETEKDILYAFYCFVSDAVSGDMEFEEFCGEFGYDTDSRTAEKTWKACKRSTAELERIYEGDIYDLANALQEAVD